jgi:hypothetical protein
MPWQFHAVIRPEKDHRVFLERVILERFDDLPT